jgi:predicted MFS family arabinose efflux permease
VAFQLISSLWTLLRDTPLLRRRALYQAALFGAFSLFWSAVPLQLAGPEFGLSQSGIACFSLAGVAGALAAPLAGRLADRGLTRLATGLAMWIAATSFLVSRLDQGRSLMLLLAGAVLLDFGVQANLVLGQREIYAIGANLRSRLNGLYMAIFFIGGAAGSSVASIAMQRGGWTAVSWIGIGLPVAAWLYFMSDRPAAR